MRGRLLCSASSSASRSASSAASTPSHLVTTAASEVAEMLLQELMDLTRDLGVTGSLSTPRTVSHTHLAQPHRECSIAAQCNISNADHSVGPIRSRCWACSKVACATPAASTGVQVKKTSGREKRKTKTYLALLSNSFTSTSQLRVCAAPAVVAPRASNLLPSWPPNPFTLPRGSSCRTQTGGRGRRAASSQSTMMIP